MKSIKMLALLAASVTAAGCGSDDNTCGDAACPDGAVLVVHSPPKGHCDTSSSGDHLGSQAILEAIEAKRPPLAVCGHIHEAWGSEDEIGQTQVINLGPSGRLIEA